MSTKRPFRIFSRHLSSYIIAFGVYHAHVIIYDVDHVISQARCALLDPIRVIVKAGLWTLEWTLEWTMDWTVD